jgi:hypothetical protein
MEAITQSKLPAASQASSASEHFEYAFLVGRARSSAQESDLSAQDASRNPLLVPMTRKQQSQLGFKQ